MASRPLSSLAVHADSTLPCQNDTMTTPRTLAAAPRYLHAEMAGHLWQPSLYEYARRLHLPATMTPMAQMRSSTLMATMSPYPTVLQQAGKGNCRDHKMCSRLVSHPTRRLM
jgi:hypothetical protein